MKKIIGIIKPFDLYQTFYVYQDEEKIDAILVKIEQMPAAVCNLAQKYKINQIDLSGSIQYAKGLAKKILKEKNLKYNNLDLTFNYI